MDATLSERSAFVWPLWRSSTACSWRPSTSESVLSSAIPRRPIRISSRSTCRCDLADPFRRRGRALTRCVSFPRCGCRKCSFPVAVTSRDGPGPQRFSTIAHWDPGYYPAKAPVDFEVPGFWASWFRPGRLLPGRSGDPGQRRRLAELPVSLLPRGSKTMKSVTALRFEKLSPSPACWPAAPPSRFWPPRKSGPTSTAKASVPKADRPPDRRRRHRRLGNHRQCRRQFRLRGDRQTRADVPRQNGGFAAGAPADVVASFAGAGRPRPQRARPRCFPGRLPGPWPLGQRNHEQRSTSGSSARRAISTAATIS